MLATSKVGASTPASDDPWVRYRHAGIDVHGIAPLLAPDPAASVRSSSAPAPALASGMDDGVMVESDKPAGSDATATMRGLGVAPDLLALLPDDVPFVLKDSQGASTSDSWPLVSGSHHSPAVLYVDKTCFWIALDPDDARRYRDLTGARIAEPKGNRTTWHLIVHPSDAQRAGAAQHLREAVKLAITRSLPRQAAAP